MRLRLPCPLLIGYLFAVVSLSVSPECVGAEDPNDPLAGFDDYVHTALDDWNTPGVCVVIVRGNETVLAKGYGLREVGKPDRADAQTIFPIASVTKVFTATGLALLVQEGKLNWDDRVVDHLPEFQLSDPYLTREVRLDDLLSHRTGLERADLLAYRGDYDRPELIRRLRYLQPVAPFRDRFGYHNLMIVTAGEILAQKSGQPWEQFVEQRILKPLHMNSSYTLRDVRPENSAAVHVLIDGEVKVDPMALQIRDEEGFRRLREAVAPAGELYTNAEDLANFLKMYVNEGMFEGKPFLKKEIVRDMGAPRSVLPIKTAPERKSFYTRLFYAGGLGWQMRDYRGRKIVYHTGSTGAVVAFMPEEKIGVAVLANRGIGIPYMIMHDTFDRMLGIPRDVTNEDWLKEGMKDPEESQAARNAELEAERKKETTPSLPLADYAGTYSSDLYGKLEISLQDDHLDMQFGPNIEATLKHWEDNTFRGKLNFPPPGDWFLKFVVENDTVKRIEIERIFWHEPMPAFVRVKTE